MDTRNSNSNPVWKLRNRLYARKPKTHLKTGYLERSNQGQIQIKKNCMYILSSINSHNNQVCNEYFVY